MRILVEGTDLPGRVFETHRDVHVAIQVRAEPVGPVPGDAPSARWEVEVTRTDDDVRGPAVHGRRGSRFLYLTWGDPLDGEWRMFRRAKLMLDPALADRPDGAEVLRFAIGLTDECGGPRCARVDPPAITWSWTDRPAASRRP